MSDNFQKFTAPRPDEELYQGKEAPQTFVLAQDGMPVPQPAQTESELPPLSEDTLICMADRRQFVIRNSDGSAWKTFPASEVKRLPNGEYFVEIVQLGEPVVSPATFFLDPHLRRTGDHNVVVVEPIRPQCRHYLRMHTDIAGAAGHRYLLRACMIQRTEEGEYYSVRDAFIPACSAREPRHYESEKALDDADDEKIRLGRERDQMAAFDIDAELDKETGLGVLG
jgi:hypothetical protein